MQLGALSVSLAVKDALMAAADGTTEGPASFTPVDPDGNPVLFDQRV